MMDDGLIYLDNAATTFPKPDVVYKEMDECYRRYGGNAGRGGNPLARKATEIVEETRSLVMEWLGAPAVIFVPSATLALNLALLGANLRSGDVVYISPFEHNSVLRPLEHLKRTKGIDIRLIPFSKETFECEVEIMRQVFSVEPPSLVCITQMGNVFGNRPPLQEVITAAKIANGDAIIVVDGAQSAGLLPLDLSLVDAFIFSGHKSLYGPYGIAGIGFGTGWRPSPIIFGGTGTNSEKLNLPVSDNSRYEVGSKNLSAHAGLRASLRYLISTRPNDAHSVSKAFSAELINRISELKHIHVIGGALRPSPEGIVSIIVDNLRPQEVEGILGSKDISIRSGLHCSPWAHEFAGTINTGGTSRISWGQFNTAIEAKTLIAELQALTN